jgi:hypothetical protein
MSTSLCGRSSVKEQLLLCWLGTQASQHSGHATSLHPSCSVFSHFRLATLGLHSPAYVSHNPMPI